MVKDAIVIYRIHGTRLILGSLKSFFHSLKSQFLTKLVLKIKEAL